MDFDFEKNHLRSRYKSIQFVSGSSELDSGPQTTEDASGSEPTNVQLSGSEVKEFYENLVAGEATARNMDQYECEQKLNDQQLVETSSQRSMQTCQKLCIDEVKQKQLNHQLLFAAQNGDLKKVTKLVKQGADVDTSDMFGWTPMMCAAYSGSHSVTEFLLNVGAQTDVKNSQGQTAVDLAKINNHVKIVDLFKIQEDGIHCAEHVEKCTELFFCDTCGQKFCETTKKKHESSTVHLFNLRKPSAPTSYHIPESSPGYQMMLKGGWDTEKGLGPRGQGRKFPVKTTLKMDRSGIGIETKAKPRITHPAPQLSGIDRLSRQSRDGTNSRKAIKKREQAKGREWERNIRMALSLD